MLQIRVLEEVVEKLGSWVLIGWVMLTGRRGVVAVMGYRMCIPDVRHKSLVGKWAVSNGVGSQSIG